MTTTEHDDAIAAALAMKVLAGMAEERGLERVSDLGDLPPLDPFTAARYLTTDEMKVLFAIQTKAGDDGRKEMSND